LADDPVHDLALISADGLSGAPIPLLAADRSVAVGAGALAIGSPLGLEFSLTDGIISAKRKLQGTDFLQMQTPIAPGSSGGPLLNRRGELIGVNTATKSANLNLAVDVKHVRELLELPRTPKALEKFVAGVRVTEVETVGVESSSIDRLSYQEGAQWLASSAEHCVQSVPEGAKVTYRSSMRDGEAEIESNLDEKSNACLREKGAFLRKAVGFFLSTAYAADLKAGKEVGLRLTLEGLPRGLDDTAEGRPLILSFLVKQ
jgi:serine protease Do